MKKLTFYWSTALLLIFLIPSQVKAAPGDDSVTNAAIETVDKDATLAAETEVLLDAALAAETEVLLDAVHATEAEVLLARLEEINEMDKSDLTRAEKRDLRNEVRQIDKTLYSNGGGGVYLSLGALIVILLLLILLL